MNVVACLTDPSPITPPDFFLLFENAGSGREADPAPYFLQAMTCVREERMSPSIKAMEASVTALIEALRFSGDPVQFDLASRLQCCQHGRKDRRRGLRSGWPPMCRSVACVFCRGWIRKEEGERAAEHFTGVDNEACSFVTIMLARTGDLDTIPGIIDGLRDALRNLRERLARRDPRWARFEAFGMVEIDAMTADEICVLPPQRRAVIEGLPSYGSGDVVWVVHVHLAVHAPGLSRDELREALQRQYPGPPERVDVRPFHSDKTAPDNAANVSSYPAKHTMEATFTRGFKEAWPLAWQLLYWGWFHGLRDGLRPLRLRLGPKGKRAKTKIKAPTPRQIVDGEVTPAQPDETREKMGNHVAILTGQKQVSVEADEPVSLTSEALAPVQGSFSTTVLGRMVEVLRRTVPVRVRATVDRIRGVFPNRPVWKGLRTLLHPGNLLRAGLSRGRQLLSLAFVLARPGPS